MENSNGNMVARHSPRPAAVANGSTVVTRHDFAKGIDEADDYNLTICGARNDTTRIQYIQDHLFYLQKAINDSVNVGGYFIWALLDNFEWNDGYTNRFGIIYVEYKNDCTKYPKKSATWLMNFLRKGYLTKPSNKILSY